MVLWRTQLPTVLPHYAVKCNPEPLLLNHLHDSGVNFDCASERELIAVAELARGRLPHRVIYANPCKSQRDLAAARDMGAPVTVVDSVEELEKLEGYEGGALVRMAVDDSAARMPFSTKFGAAAADVPAIAAAARAKKVQLCGVSFHVGSGSAGDSAIAAAIRTAYFAGILKLREAGHTGARLLDIGGGFLADPADFRRKAMGIRGAMTEVEWAERDAKGASPGLQWIAEPGRFYAKDAMDFFVQVIGKKPCATGGWKYTIDDSLYGQFSSILFDYQAPTWYRVRGPAEKERGRAPGVLFGRTCDSVDVIANAESMEELAVGDWLWFPAMGAYTRATATEFNGFPRPPVVEASALPDLTTLKSSPEFCYAAPAGLTMMPPVSARAFWTAVATAGANGKN